jgi:hypothetical protein
MLPASSLPSCKQGLRVGHELRLLDGVKLELKMRG